MPRSGEERNAYQRRYRRARGMKERVRRERKPCAVCGTPIRLENRQFCSWACWERDRYELWIERWKRGDLNPDHQEHGRVPAKIKRWWIEHFGERCMLCGWNMQHPLTRKVPLEWNHINGDCSDNRYGNLQLLCPNCHALTENHGKLNYGKSKRRRKWAGVVIVQRIVRGTSTGDPDWT